MSTVPFNQRFGTNLSQPTIDQDVPATAKTGLIGILHKLSRKDCINWENLADEALQKGRKLKGEFPKNSNEEICSSIIMELAWDRFYIFCEKAYCLLQSYKYFDQEIEDWVESISLEKAQLLYTIEINELMVEENLAYEFVDGIFQRRGRPQTQKTIQQMGSILANPAYQEVRNHYHKALKFFRKPVEPDFKNCIKEAVSALEAFVAITLDPKKTAKDFDRIIQTKQGTAEEEIPSMLADCMIKLRAFRGHARGVAHAAPSGSIVDQAEAELTLNLVASYITYLHDKFPKEEDDIPF